jgi:two-component system response regulator CpxR
MVDDDVELATMTQEYLKQEGFAVELAHDGPSCLALDPDLTDLVILDIMLPGVSGFEVLRSLRKRSSVPVILVTARDDDIDRIVGLEIGADDYIAKPVNPRVLVARIRAMLRRTGSASASLSADCEVGDVRLHSASRNVWRGGERIELTTAEFNLLDHLLRRAGQIVSRDDLSAAAFGRSDGARVDRNVDTLVSKVRRKLGTSNDLEGCIKTVRNVGYVYTLPAGFVAEDRYDAPDTLQ